MVKSHSAWIVYQSCCRIVMRHTDRGMVAILARSVDDHPDPVGVPNLRAGTEVRQDEGGS